VVRRRSPRGVEEEQEGEVMSEVPSVEVGRQQGEARWLTVGAWDHEGWHRGLHQRRKRAVEAQNEADGREPW
jgi:hypothetical protein